jgi:AP-1 complex subunit beta-1
VLADRPVITDDAGVLEPGLLDVLMRNLSSLAAVYHKPPEAFVRRARPVGSGEEEDDDGMGAGGDDDEVNYGDDEVAAPAGGAGAGAAPAISGNDDDLLGLGGGAPPAPAPVAAAVAPVQQGGGGGNLDDLFGMGGGGGSKPASSGGVPSYPVLGEKDGLTLRGGLARRGGAPVFDLVVENAPDSAAPVGAMQLKFNVNPVGLAPAGVTVTLSPPVPAGGVGHVAVPLVFNPALVGSALPADAGAAGLQAALKDVNSGRVAFFSVPLAYGAACFVDEPPVDRAGFVPQWRDLGGDKEAADVARECASVDPAAVQARLAAGRVAFVASRPGPSPELSMHYFTARGLDAAGSPGGAVFLVELTFKAGLAAIKVVVKTPAGAEPYGRLAVAAVKALLK